MDNSWVLQTLLEGISTYKRELDTEEDVLEREVGSQIRDKIGWYP